jgi:hypothetical protein
MPRVTLRGDRAADGKEEVLSEYICDYPDCPNIAVHVLGVVVELRSFAAICEEHARQLANRSEKP